MTKGAAVAQSRVPLEDGAAVKTTNVPIKVTATKSGWTAIDTFGIVLTAVGAATDANGILVPYADIHAVRYVLIALAVMSATASMVMAAQRARAGATT